MGWYLRKSFGFGPLRLNLSKSGVGYSVGVRGARIGANSRGTYIRMGRGGIYYQKYVQTNSPGQRTEPVPIQPQFTEPELANVIQTASASSLQTPDHLQSSGGLNYLIQASNLQKANSFAQAVRQYGAQLAVGQSALPS